MEGLKIINTDADWKPNFIDRNSNKDAELFKLLKIKNFGVYFNDSETNNLSVLEYSKVSKALHSLFPKGSSAINGIDYLIKPSKVITSDTNCEAP